MSFVKSFALFKSKQPEREAAQDDTPIHDWSPECAAFLRFWSSLAADGGIPTSEAFLDVPSPRFAAYVYMVEMVEGAPVVRLQGTQLVQAWSRDLTGEDFYPGRSARFKTAAIANMNTVLQHPCGHLARATYATSKGRTIVSDWIQLPLAVREGRAPRIVGAAFHRPSRAFEVELHHFELHKLAWLDAGFGVPAAPPVPLAG